MILMVSFKCKVRRSLIIFKQLFILLSHKNELLDMMLFLLRVVSKLSVWRDGWASGFVAGWFFEDINEPRD